MNKAAGDKNDRMIDMTLKELSEYSIPAGHRERMDRIKESFDRRDYEEIVSLSSVTEDML